MKKEIIIQKQLEFINDANLLHEFKYNYSKIVFKTKTQNVIIICPIHGEFQQSPKSHLKGCGCQKCGRENIRQANVFSIDKFITEANYIHNNIYDYNKFNYINYATKGIIICKLHGEFLQTPSAHIHQKQNCPKCANIKVKQTKAHTAKQFIEAAHKVHNFLYDYSKFIYVNAKNNGIITCKVHGDFLQCPDSHLHGRGCQRCSGKISNKNIFMENAIKTHGLKYDYSKYTYIDCKTKSIIICKTHGEYLQNANNHLQGKGCPKCSSNISHLETTWLDSLNILNRNIKLEINKKIIKADGFNPNTNTIYEFHGDFWHGNPKIYNFNDINPANNKTFGELFSKTIERESLIKNAGYNLIVMWEYDWLKQNE